MFLEGRTTSVGQGNCGALTRRLNTKKKYSLGNEFFPTVYYDDLALWFTDIPAFIAPWNYITGKEVSYLFSLFKVTGVPIGLDLPHNSHSLIQLFGGNCFSKSTKVASDSSDKTKPPRRTFWSLLLNDMKALVDLITMPATLQCFSLNKRLRNITTTKPTTHDSLYCKLLPSGRSNTCGERDCKGDKADFYRNYCCNQAPFVYHLKDTGTILAFLLACCLIAERILIKNILLNLQIMAAQPRSH